MLDELPRSEYFEALVSEALAADVSPVGIQQLRQKLRRGPLTIPGCLGDTIDRELFAVCGSRYQIADTGLYPPREDMLADMEARLRAASVVPDRFNGRLRAAYCQGPGTASGYFGNDEDRGIYGAIGDAYQIGGSWELRELSRLRRGDFTPEETERFLTLFEQRGLLTNRTPPGK